MPLPSPGASTWYAIWARRSDPPGSIASSPGWARPGTRAPRTISAGFERRGFITAVDGNRVEFDYRGLNEELTGLVTPADVIWACELLERLPDGHWQDAFRAGGYDPATATRFIAKIKQKVGQGLALRTRATGR